MEPGEIQRLGYMFVHAGLPRGLYILGEGVGGYGDYGELPHIVKGAVAGSLDADVHELHDVVDDSKTEIRGKPLGGWGGRIAIFISG